MKDKRPTPAPAKDLYTSTLFAGRRRYVERTCTEWWILSAGHGLVHPDQVLAPYDVTLKTKGRHECRGWTAAVLRDIDGRIRPGPGDVIEVHAGSEYRDFGLLEGLQTRGCAIVIPTEGMAIGKQLQFSKQAAS